MPEAKIKDNTILFSTVSGIKIHILKPEVKENTSKYFRVSSAAPTFYKFKQRTN
jgi:hypothetical protein